MIDPKRIAELKALATRDAEVRADPGRFRWTVQTEWQAQYSAAAREAVPALIAEVERLRGEILERADSEQHLLRDVSDLLTRAENAEARLAALLGDKP